MRIPLPLSIPSLLLVLALFFAGASVSVAQNFDTAGRWKEFRIQSPSNDSFYAPFLAKEAPFFLDPLNGYITWSTGRGIHTPDTSEFGQYRTTDGGDTWQRVYQAVPIPHVLKGNLGLSPSGLV